VLRFSDRVNDKALRDFVPALYEAVNRGYDQLVLDFRRSTRAYADAVLPIVCLVDHRRSRGNRFRLELPEDPTLRQLFLNANWANFLDPAHPMLALRHPQHLPASRYLSHTEQQEAVDSVLRIVLRSMELRRSTITALEWSLNEITDNVLNHAKSPTGGLVQVNTFHDQHVIKFVVADAGRGIPVAMRDAFPQLRDDEAISEAVKTGVTSVPDSGQGNGLAGSLRIATQSLGSFKITAGKARLSVFKDGRTGRYRTQKGAAPSGYRFPGTVVMLELRTDTDFAIEDALALDQRSELVELTDIVDLRYSSGGGELVIRLCDEALGFGTRHAGVELRRKCQNLLNAEPGKRLVLDWAGVPLVSSSFADEAVGKLFVEMGPTDFAARVSHVNTEELVRSLFDRAVLQRVAQSLNPPPSGG
jgi:anti-sigma regulatory factor (Ser/Thr protein kinase)